MSELEHAEQDAPERETLLSQVEHSLAEAEHGARYAAASALAEHYAFLIDCAAPHRTYATAIRVLQKFIDNEITTLPYVEQRETLSAWDKITSALAEHSVASDLGPKLLAALERLDLTVVASAKPGRPPGQQPAPAAPPTPITAEGNALRLLRGGAAERTEGARG